MGRTFWFVLAAAGLLVFLYRVRIILTPFLFAVLIAYTLYPLVVAVERRGASRAVAILTVYLCLGIALGVIAWLVLPRFVAELEDLLVQLPARTRAWRQLGERARQLYQRLRLPELVGENDVVGVVVQRLEAAIENLAGRLMSLVMSAFTNIVSLIISPVLAFYFLRDHQSMRNRTLRYVPAKYRGDVQNITRSINQALGGFFRGQILVSIFVGLFVYMGLYLLGIPYAMFIGLTAGLFDIIPYLGPILGFLPAAAFALLKSPLTVFWVLLIFVAANQIENGIISPKIIGDRVGLHPLVVIFAVFAGGDLLGITGMLLAVPVAAAIRVVLDYFLLRPPVQNP